MSLENRKKLRNLDGVNLKRIQAKNQSFFLCLRDLNYYHHLPHIFIKPLIFMGSVWLVVEFKMRHEWAPVIEQWLMNRYNNHKSSIQLQLKPRSQICLSSWPRLHTHTKCQVIVGSITYNTGERYKSEFFRNSSAALRWEKLISFSVVGRGWV